MCRRAKRALRVGLGLAAAAVLAPPTAYAMEVVFDPTNFAKQVEQVAQQVQMVQQLRQQVQNQLQMIRGWGFSQLQGILQSMGQWQQVFGGQGGPYGTTDPGGALDQQYPSDPGAYASTSDADVQDTRDRWEQEQRRVLIENRTVQNHVYRDLAATAQRMGQYVEKSNAAPGTTAAVQAGNEELATLVAQLQAMQAQEITDARGDVEQAAQEQAEAAYGEAQRLAVRGGWDNPQPPATGLVNPFPSVAQ
jgi:P-type conjugative transfer protein TrbJ